MAEKTLVPDILKEDLENAKNNPSKSLTHQGVSVIDGEVYFDTQTHDNVAKKKIHEDLEFHDALDNPNLKHSDSLSSIDSVTSDGKTDRSSSPDSVKPEHSVKALAAKFEKKSPMPENKTNQTVGISGKYSGKDLEEIRANIRKAVDPHTYQKDNEGNVVKTDYGHHNKGNYRG